MENKNLYRIINNKIKIVNVIKHYIKLTKKGKNFIAMCPFHSDTNPSLSISESLNIFKCFSCNAKGNAISFIMKKDNLLYHNALIKAAELSGISPNEYSFLFKNKNEFDLNEKLYSLNNYISDCYSKFLFNEENKKILDYLIKNRKLLNEQINYFNIGYAPYKKDIKHLEILIQNYNEKSNLINSTNNFKFTNENLLDVGLLTHNEQGENINFFRNRIVFPIHDENNKIVGFSGRIIEKTIDNQVKYINTKETRIFQKQNILYNLNRIINDNYDWIYLCEGFMDVIALHKKNIKNSVALMGISISEHHLKLLNFLFKNKNKKIVLAMDNDLAGKEATISIAKILIQKGFIVDVLNFLSLDNIKDIDEMINNKHDDIESCDYYLTNKLNFFEWYYKYLDSLKINWDFESINDKVKELINWFFIFKNNNEIYNKNINVDFSLKSIEIIYSLFNKLNDEILLEQKEFLIQKYKKTILENKMGVDSYNYFNENFTSDNYEDINYIDSLEKNILNNEFDYIENLNKNIDFKKNLLSQNSKIKNEINDFELKKYENLLETISWLFIIYIKYPEIPIDNKLSISDELMVEVKLKNQNYENNKEPLFLIISIINKIKKISSKQNAFLEINEMMYYMQKNNIFNLEEMQFFKDYIYIRLHNKFLANRDHFSFILFIENLFLLKELSIKFEILELKNSILYINDYQNWNKIIKYIADLTIKIKNLKEKKSDLIEKFKRK